MFDKIAYRCLAVSPFPKILYLDSLDLNQSHKDCHPKNK